MYSGGMKTEQHVKARKLIAKRLLHFRKARLLSQDDFAALTGIHRASIGVYERCEKGIGIDTIGKICDALGIDIVDFFNA